MIAIYPFGLYFEILEMGSQFFLLSQPRSGYFALISVATGNRLYDEVQVDNVKTGVTGEELLRYLGGKKATVVTSGVIHLEKAPNKVWQADARSEASIKAG